jgi:hypothetical protein
VDDQSSKALQTTTPFAQAGLEASGQVSQGQAILLVGDNTTSALERLPYQAEVSVAVKE